MEAYSDMEFFFFFSSSDPVALDTWHVRYLSTRGKKATNISFASDTDGFVGYKRELDELTSYPLREGD